MLHQGFSNIYTQGQDSLLQIIHPRPVEYRHMCQRGYPAEGGTPAAWHTVLYTIQPRMPRNVPRLRKSWLVLHNFVNNGFNLTTRRKWTHCAITYHIFQLHRAMPHRQSESLGYADRRSLAPGFPGRWRYLYEQHVWPFRPNI